MTKKTTNPLNQLEKQLTPLKGEVESDKARIQANVFASQIKARLKSKGANLK